MSRYLAFISISVTFLACSNFGKFWDGPPLDSKGESSGAIDTTAPTTPTGWSATSGGSTQITLSWTASTDETTLPSGIVYEICQSTTAGICNTFTVSFTTGAGAVNFNATGLTASTTYYYRIRAKDAAGNVSVAAAEVNAATAAPGTVNAPGFAPTAGTFNATQNVVITTSTGGAIICYTTDASAPSCDGPKTGCIAPATLYGAAVSIPTTTTLRAIGCLAANTDSSITTGVYTIDSTPPTVTNVTSSTANGTYSIGQTINIQVTFSEVVTVTGTPQLSVMTASPATTAANYVSGSGTNTLTFDYVVGANNASADLDYAGTGALVFNGGNIVDAAGNAANLTLPLPGAAGSLGANKAIAIDGTVPAVTNVSASNADGTYGIGTVVTVQVFFSEAVTVNTGGGTPALLLSTGSPATTAATYTSGSGSTTLLFSYTVVAGNFSADLDYASTGALSLNGGTIRDAALNNASLTLGAVGGGTSLGGNKALVIDGAQPTVTGVTATVADGTYGIGTAITVRVMFSENVFVGGTPQLIMATGTPATTTINYVSGSGSNMLDFSYTVASGNSSPDLDYNSNAALGLNGGSIQDASGNQAILGLANPGAAGSLGGGRAIVIDGIAPSITGIAPASATNVIDTMVSYTLSKNCASGSIVWNRTGGDPDPGSPRNQALTGGELTAGPHNGIVITNNPLLVPGAVYTVQFNCTDAAGNASAAPPSTNVMFAPPGVIWTTATSPSAAPWSSLAFGAGVFVAAASSGNQVIYSSNGTSWTTANLPVTGSWSVMFDGAQFIAVQASSTQAATSPDGITWTARTLPSSANWKAGAAGAGIRVAYAPTSTAALSTPDGITWTARTLPAAATWQAVAFGGSKFVMISSGSSQIATSADGMSWASGNLPTTGSWQGISYGAGKYLVVESGTVNAYTSTDAAVWTAQTLPAAANWKPVAYGANTFAVLGTSSTMAATSVDGVTWSLRTLPVSAAWVALAFGNGKFVAVAGGSTTVIVSP